jgi:hypothetical protein
MSSLGVHFFAIGDELWEFRGTVAPIAVISRNLLLDEHVEPFLETLNF